MVALASAFVRMRPEVDRREYERSGRQASDSFVKTFNPGVKDGTEKGIDQGLEEAKRRAAAQGGEAGKRWGDGFYRDANGKIRDAQGKFVASSVTGGENAGKGFARGFGKGSKGIVGSIKANLGAAAGIFVPLGLAAAVGEIGKIGMAYEDNLNIFKSVSKATADQMAAVSEKARQLGADVQLPGVSAAGAAAAMTELAKAGFTVQESMDAAKGTLQLARVANISEAEAATIAANAVNAFGIDAKETMFVVDELAAAANSSSLEISDASLSFKMAGAVFSSFQGSTVGSKEAITELNTAIAILGNNGIKGSDAGTSLKQMLLQLTGPTQQAKDQMVLLAQRAGGANVSLQQQTDVLHGSKAVREEALAQIAKMNPGMEAMGDIAYDSAGKMRPLRDIIGLVTAGTKGMTDEERNYAITQIFGADASRSVIALMKGGLPVYDAQRKAIMEQGAAASFAAAKNAGLRGAIDNVRSQLENAAISVYNAIKGPLTTGLNAIAAALPGIFAGIGKLAGFLWDIRGVLIGAAYAWGVYTVAVKASAAANAIAAAGGIIPFLTKFVTAIRAATAGQIAFNVALVANPIGIAVVAIGAFVAAVVVAYRNSEKFRSVVQAVWAAIKVAFTATIDWFVNTLWPSLKRAWDQLASVAMWLWRNVIEPVWSGIRKAIQVAVQVVMTSLQGWKLFFDNVLFPVIRFLYENVVRPIFARVAKAIEVAWFIIKIAFAAFQLYLKNVLFPIIRFLYENVVKPIFRAIGALISAWWNGVIKPVFNNVKAAFSAVGSAIASVWRSFIRPTFEAIARFIVDRVVPGFRKGTDMIKAAWDKVKEYARAPVAFVVNHVINPFIGGLNKAASIVGIKDRLEPITGFASGGQIPGRPSRKDNMLASITGTGRPLAVASGEFITNTRSTLANLPLVKAINAKRGKVTHADVDPYLDGGDGHGQGDGIGDLWNKIVKGAKGIGSAITNPSEALRKVADAAIARVPGAGYLKDMVIGAGRRLINGAIAFVKDKLSFGGIGSGSVLGGWQGMRRLIAARFPGLGMISGFRPGARTLSGNRSYHSLGRAVDYPANRALAAWIKATYGKNTKELITPWQDLNLHNGRPHTYTGAVWNQHNFAGGNAHVHWAAQMGGLISRLSGMPIKLFDSGGAWPSGTLGANLSGRTEYVNANRHGEAGAIHVHFHNSVVASEQAAEAMVVKAVKSARNKKKI